MTTTTTMFKPAHLEGTVDDVCSCQICFEEFNPDRQPKFLPCSHTFCLACIQKHAEAHNSLVSDAKFPCPMCRLDVSVPANGLQNLPNNIYIGKVLDVLEQQGFQSSLPPPYGDQAREVCDICMLEGQVKDATVHCFDCGKKFCLECREEHTSTAGFGNHKVNLVVRDQAKCDSHPQFDVSTYCRDHDCCVCVACTMKQHKTCTLISVGAFIDEKKTSLESLLERCKGKLGGMNEKVSASTAKLRELNAQMVKLQQCMEITKANINRERGIREELVESANELTHMVKFAEQSLSKATSVEETVITLCPLEKSLQVYLSDGTIPAIPSIHSPPAVDAASLAEEAPYECVRAMWLPDDVVYGNVSYGDCYGRKGSTVIFDVQTSPDGFTAFVDVENRQLVIFDPKGKATVVWRHLQSCHMVNSASSGVISPRLCTSVTWVKLDGVEGFAVILLETEQKKSWLGVLAGTETHHKLKVFTPQGIVRKTVVLDQKARLVSPSGLAVTKHQQIIVSDLDKNCLFFFDKYGNLVRTFGSYGNGDAQFDMPLYLSTDKEALYISDSLNNCVKMFTFSGDFLGKIGKPFGNILNSQRKLDSNSSSNGSSAEGEGSLLTNQSTKPDSELYRPGGVCMYRDMVIVSDTGNNKVKLFTKTGQFVQVLAVMESPRGVCVTREENIVISYGGVYSTNHGVKVINIPQEDEDEDSVEEEEET
ncbi:tripartite motif-containing protein 2 [Lingula anatina]|uniref:Tripartite motif-containing protein 2 n=1 Tax=Lingula anatina TaxID=7574 RepID=A0A1S3IN05_LINAN|nr:tripartite motif-containing protein 2 [Lingula anatina]|eukprot:XP_013399281.1 tripartite motif-containing protein 2 [Lingula anatina]